MKRRWSSSERNDYILRINKCNIDFFGLTEIFQSEGHLLTVLDHNGRPSDVTNVNLEHLYVKSRHTDNKLFDINSEFYRPGERYGTHRKLSRVPAPCTERGRNRLGLTSAQRGRCALSQVGQLDIRHTLN